MKCEKCGKEIGYKWLSCDEVPNYCSDCTWNYVVEEEAMQYGISEEELTQRMYKCFERALYDLRTREDMCSLVSENPPIYKPCYLDEYEDAIVKVVIE
jgi:hypothetical protein